MQVHKEKFVDCTSKSTQPHATLPIPAALVKFNTMPTANLGVLLRSSLSQHYSYQQIAFSLTKTSRQT